VYIPLPFKEIEMARECSVCGKAARTGKVIVRHGLEKRKGGIGLHTTGISTRRFLPNLHRVRCMENGTPVRQRVCAACIKAGKVTKA